MCVPFWKYLESMMKDRELVDKKKYQMIKLIYYDNPKCLGLVCFRLKIAESVYILKNPIC